MGECGCISCGMTYKLPAPNGWYVFQMNPGCDYCCVGSTIHISMPETSNLYFGEIIDDIPLMPTIGQNKEVISVIKCGIPKDQAEQAAIKVMVGSGTEDNKIDEYLAEILGADFWDEAMQQSPSVVVATNMENKDGSR
jgi:hypothetical protein